MCIKRLERLVGDIVFEIFLTAYNFTWINFCVADFGATLTTPCACGTARCCGGRSRWSWVPRRRRCWRATATPTPDPDQVRHYFTTTRICESRFFTRHHHLFFFGPEGQRCDADAFISQHYCFVRNLNRFGTRKREQRLFSSLPKNEIYISVFDCVGEIIIQENPMFFKSFFSLRYLFLFSASFKSLHPLCLTISAFNGVPIFQFLAAIYIFSACSWLPLV